MRPARTQQNRTPRTRAARRMLATALLLTLGAGALTCTVARPPDAADPTDGGAAPRPDLREPELTGSLGCRGEPCGDVRPCGPGARCVDGACLPDAGTCRRDADCSGDRRCLGGACVAFDACTQLPPYQPACREAAFPSDAFTEPALRCEFTGLNSITVPIVADLDRDGVTEVLTVGFTGPGAELVALRGDTCALRWRKRLPLLSDGESNIAVADLDADGKAEIVALDSERRIVVLDHNGELRATAPVPMQETNAFARELWTAPAIADVDGAAPPEIVAGAQVARFIPGPPARIDVLWTRENKTAFWGSASIVADLDGDGRAEVVTSDRVYDGVSGADRTPPGLADQPFYAQVADFNLDGRPDLLLVESQQGRQVVRVYDFAARRTIFGPYRAGAGGWGGPAVVADFDADGVPDFGVGGASWFYAYSLRCASEPRPVGCTGHEPGLLWAARIDDRSSGSAAASAFDLNGDGAAEVVFRDECWLRVLDGFSGRTLAARTLTSSTGIELPVIADADGDGRADIVVTSDVDIDHFGYCPRAGRPEAQTQTPWRGWSRGVFVLSDPRWRPARPVWNQHSYHATHIRDDLTVPAREPDSWTAHNTYRANVPPVAVPRPRPLTDLVGKIEPVQFPRDCAAPWPLRASVCNRGAGATAGPVAATFYDGDPGAGGRVVCTATAPPLAPGACAAIGCAWTPPPTARTDLFLRVDDDGAGGRAGGQCRDDNDVSVYRDLACFRTPS